MQPHSLHTFNTIANSKSSFSYIIRFKVCDVIFRKLYKYQCIDYVIQLNPLNWLVFKGFVVHCNFENYEYELRMEIICSRGRVGRQGSLLGLYVAIYVPMYHALPNCIIQLLFTIIIIFSIYTAPSQTNKEQNISLSKTKVKNVWEMKWITGKESL